MDCPGLSMWLGASVKRKYGTLPYGVEIWNKYGISPIHSCALRIAHVNLNPEHGDMVHTQPILGSK